MTSLSVDTLNLFYGTHHALRDVSLDVPQGGFVALLGPSGCGKTSLLRCIAGFMAPASGSIRVGGSDITALPPRRRNMGLVFQSYALFPHMTALENICFGLESRGVRAAEARRRAAEALALVGLAERAGQRPRQLSGGQQQRVALARALVIEPDILLLDEPLGALDRKLRLQLQSELKALQRRLGVTAVMVTHDQEEALALADRVAVMQDGVIAQMDTPERLFRAPRTAWVADFIGAGSVVPPGAGMTALRFDGPPPPAEAHLFLPADRLTLEPAEGSALVVESARYLGRGFEIEAAGEGMRLRALAGEGAVPAPGTPVRALVAAGGWHELES